MKPYLVTTGCYGGRRGTLVGKLTEAFIHTEFDRAIPTKRKPDICIMPRGLASFMQEGRLGVPVPPKFVDALERVIQDEVFVVLNLNIECNQLLKALPVIRAQPRQAATLEELRKVNAVYTADADAAGFYYGLSQGTEKYTPLPSYDTENPCTFATMLRTAGMSHVRYGTDLDDSEAPIAFVLEEIIRPRLEKAPKPGKKPEDYPYYNLAGNEFAISDPAALAAEAQDLLRVSQALAKKIIQDAYAIPEDE